MLWKPVAGYANYEVSETGSVRRSVASRWLAAGELLRASVKKGYLSVGLNYAGGERRITVHRLVALAFLPPPAAGQNQVAHNDGNRLNNAASNLRWATARENSADRVQHGTLAESERHGRAKLSAAQVVEIRASYRKNNLEFGASALARKYGVSDVAIIKAIRGTTWKSIKANACLQTPPSQ